MQRLPENWVFEVDLDGYNISVGHRLQGEHRLAVMERSAISLGADGGGVLGNTRGEEQRNVFFIFPK